MPYTAIGPVGSPGRAPQGLGSDILPYSFPLPINTENAGLCAEMQLCYFQIHSPHSRPKTRTQTAAASCGAARAIGRAELALRLSLPVERNPPLVDGVFDKTIQRRRAPCGSWRGARARRFGRSSRRGLRLGHRLWARSRGIECLRSGTLTSPPASLPGNSSRRPNRRNTRNRPRSRPTSPTRSHRTSSLSTSF